MSCFYDRYQDYCKWLSQQPFSERTKRVYAARITAFLEYQRSCGTTTLSEDTLPSAITAFREHLIVNQYARPTTVNSYLTVIAQFCRYFEWSCSNLKTSRIKHGDATTKYLTETEGEQYADAIDRCAVLRDRVLARLILFAGIRLGESVALNVEDVEVSIPVALRLSVRAPRLRLNLDQKTGKLLTEWLFQRHGLLTPESTEQALFVTKGGNRLSPKGVDFVLRRIGISCGLVVSARMLRNTYVRRIQNGDYDSLTHLHNVDAIIERPAEVAIYAQPNSVPGAIQIR